MKYRETQKSHIPTLKHLLIAPFVLFAIIPIVILDLYVEIYHRITFPLYGFSYVKRKKYIKIDRHKLPYLTNLQKMFCVYCGYANGLVYYWTEIMGKTEEYWCGIQHDIANSPDFHKPKYHKNFIPYGDKDAYEKIMEAECRSCSKE